MSVASPANITVLCTTAQEDQATYLIGEVFDHAAITVLVKEEKHTSYGTIFASFYTEKQMTFVLSMPVTPAIIREIADLAAIGVILGFIVRGEIDLGGRVINNVYGTSEPPRGLDRNDKKREEHE